MDYDNDHGITPELITDILNSIKLVLGITDTSKDDILTLYINAVCNNILIKTNRRIFVPELKYVVMNLVADKWNSDRASLDDTLNSIQSMAEAGRSVTFGVSSVIGNKLNLIAQKQLEENEILINKYKLLYKT